ncbi:MAG: hypothetical protein EF812_01030 [Methanosarcinales archaeon]|nr:MAG: hypothetical protein EF812_01030 [Methanosarcinales archaeon]
MTQILKGPYDRSLATKKIVIDTGPLLIHATGVFRHDKLKDVCLCDFPDEEFTFLDRLFISGKRFYITPYVLSELLYLIRNKLRLNEDGVEKFFHNYGDFLSKIEESHIDKGKMIDDSGIKFGLADVSLLKTYEKNGALILSGDETLCQFCDWRKIEYIEYKTFFFNSFFI